MSRIIPEPIQQYGGTTAKHQTYYGKDREITVDTDKHTLVVQDGVTLGGHPLAKEAIQIIGSEYITVNGGASNTLATDSVLAIILDKLISAIVSADTNNQITIGSDGKLYIPSKYDIGQYYWFQDNNTRDGMVYCNGATITSASSNCPQLVEYLQTTEGAARCVTAEEYDALNNAVYFTDPDGVTYSWGGVGGANKFVLDLAKNTVRIPDLRGMTSENVGFGQQALGDVHADAIRGITGRAPNITPIYSTAYKDPVGAFFYHNATGLAPLAATDENKNNGGLSFDSGLIVPSADRNQVQAWIAKLCVYVGSPV